MTRRSSGLTDRARPPASSSAVRKRMQVTKRRDTPAELALRSALHRLGLRFRVDAPIIGSRRRADVLFSKHKVAIFVDGCFWHGCPVHGTWPKTNSDWWREKIESNRKRDKDTDLKLERLGWVALRFWTHDDMDRAARLISCKLQRVSRKVAHTAPRNS
jgi:DNA mismatch endonuclease (patch repair protein)